jgi:hypothetical protein
MPGICDIMKRVYIARHPTDAHLFRGLLLSRGIEAVVRGDSLFATRGESPLTPDTLPSVWVVNDNDLEEAQRLAAEYSSAAPSESTGELGWICPVCKEERETQFTECWRCGFSRAS